MEPIPVREPAGGPVRPVGEDRDEYVPDAPPEPDGRERSLASYYWIVREEKWTVVAVAALAVALSAAYLLVATPVYEATSVVQVEHRRQSLFGADELSAALGETPPAEPEIAILRSRMLIAAVAEQLRLTVDVRPRTLPIVGRAIARRHAGEAPAPAPLGLDRFAWGGERARVDELEVPEKLLDRPLLLTALEGGRLVLHGRDGAILVEGAVGKRAVAGEGAGRVELLVSELVARPGAQFWLTKRSEDVVIDELQKRLVVQESGKSRSSGVLSIGLQGSDPAVARDIVNGIAGAYLRQNVERRSAEAAKTLEFLEKQLPKLKADVDDAEDALNAYRVRSGTVDPSSEAKGLVDRIAQLEKEIADAEVKRTELLQTFTMQHPTLVAVANKLALLRAERAALAGRVRSAPQAELDTARLTRELKDATDLYVGLLNKAQELRVAKSGTVGDVRIIDRAYVPKEPLKPRKPTVLGLGLALGLAGGVAGAILRRSWVECAESADEVEDATGVAVYVTIPHSDHQAKLARATRRRGQPPPLLAVAGPSDVAIEAVRSLRTTLRFALVEARNNVVALTGPAPGVGKSFLAANLAQVLADTGGRVVLVDADLRRGRMHRQFGLDRSPGLSDAMTGAVAIEDVIREVPGSALSVIATGSLPPNPAELLLSGAFQSLLEDLSGRFDLVIVDTPPVLAVTDAMIVARFAGVNFLVLRAGRHTQREIALAVKEFALNRVRLHGAVLNDVPVRHGRNAATGYVRYAYSADAVE
jgi:tyrosine-protein kinase Etk/Wzc